MLGFSIEILARVALLASFLSGVLQSWLLGMLQFQPLHAYKVVDDVTTKLSIDIIQLVTRDPIVDIYSNILKENK
jgi:2-phosphoglycerate kinase